MHKVQILALRVSQRATQSRSDETHLSNHHIEPLTAKRHPRCKSGCTAPHQRTRAILTALTDVLHIRSISRPYPDRPPSHLERIYLYATPREESK